MSSTTVGRLLHSLGYRLQWVRKRQEGTVDQDRNAQFEHVNARADEMLAAGQPVISVDTKKKELVVNFANAGREWQPKGRRRRCGCATFRATRRAGPFRTGSTTWLAAKPG